MKRILALAAGLFAAAAQGAPPVTVYEVEVIVFENHLTSLEGGELWTRTAPRPAPMFDLAEAVNPTDTAPLDSPLSTAVSSLQREGSYRVLLHQRWRQSAEEKSASKPVRLQTTDNQLDGGLRFYMSRFLHVDVDLTLKEKDANDRGYRLVEHRRIKTQELNYFDHPKLGVLVKITPVGKNDAARPTVKPRRS